MFPKYIKVGRTPWEIVSDNDELSARGRYGETIPDPPRINISIEKNPAAGETLFHEICHAVELTSGIEFFKNDDDSHIAYICMLYTALCENGFLASTICSLDRIEKLREKGYGKI